MSKKQLNIPIVAIIVATGIIGGIVAFFLPGQLGITSPDKWYDNPIMIVLTGLLLGGIVGWVICTVTNRQSHH